MGSRGVAARLVGQGDRGAHRDARQEHEGDEHPDAQPLLAGPQPVGRPGHDERPGGEQRIGLPGVVGDAHIARQGQEPEPRHEERAVERHAVPHAEPGAQGLPAALGAAAGQEHQGEEDVEQPDGLAVPEEGAQEEGHERPGGQAHIQGAPPQETPDGPRQSQRHGERLVDQERPRQVPAVHCGARRVEAGDPSSGPLDALRHPVGVERQGRADQEERAPEEEEVRAFGEGPQKGAQAALPLPAPPGARDEGQRAEAQEGGVDAGARREAEAEGHRPRARGAGVARLGVAPQGGRSTPLQRAARIGQSAVREKNTHAGATARRAAATRAPTLPSAPRPQ